MLAQLITEKDEAVQKPTDERDGFNNITKAASITFVVTHLRTNKTNSNVHMNRKDKGVGGGHVPHIN